MTTDTMLRPREGSLDSDLASLGTETAKRLASKGSNGVSAQKDAKTAFWANRWRKIVLHKVLHQRTADARTGDPSTNAAESEACARAVTRNNAHQPMITITIDTVLNTVIAGGPRFGNGDTFHVHDDEPLQDVGSDLSTGTTDTHASAGSCDADIESADDEDSRRHSRESSGSGGNNSDQFLPAPADLHISAPAEDQATGIIIIVSSTRLFAYTLSDCKFLFLSYTEPIQNITRSNVVRFLKTSFNRTNCLKFCSSCIRPARLPWHSNLMTLIFCYRNVFLEIAAYARYVTSVVSLHRTKYF